MKRLLTALVAAAAFWTSGCGGGGGTTITPPPPSGNFSPASLNGTYAFMTSGEVCAGCVSAASPMVRVGSFVADGNKGILGGVEDVNTSGTPSGAIAITGGSYTVNADGRGTLTLQLGSNTLEFGIVLTSTSDGLMIDETSNANQASTGSGNFIKQDTTVCSSPVSSVAGTYVFDFAGLDSSGSPESFVGEFTANNGATAANLGDINDSGTLSNGTFTAAFGTDGLTAAGPDACGRGLAQIVTGAVTETYAYYVVDATRVRFINSAGGEMLSGDAVFQSGGLPTAVSAINSSFSFLVAGGSANGGLTRVGRLTAGGSTLSKMLMDVNDATNEIQFDNLSNGSITNYDGTTGRGTFSFQDSNGTIYSFIFYLSSPNGGVIQDVSPSSTAGFARVVADGSILGQSGSPFTSSNVSGGYALSWSGLETASGTFQDEEDILGQVNVNNLVLSGTTDAFQFTSSTLTPQTNIGTAGQINFNGGDGTGDDGKRVNMTVNLSNASPIHMVVYIVSPQLAFFENMDNNGAPRIVAGILKAQQ